MKTAIIGAGINGLYLAWKLADKGNEVVVFEKKEKIGKQVCSGLFSERILDFIPHSRKLIRNTINSTLIHFPKKTVNIEFSQNFFVMSHFELDNLAAGLARRAGAKIALNSPVRRMSELADFDRVIGCFGSDSTIRKSFENLPKPDYRLAIQGFHSEKNSSSFVETWPINQGFIWKIPRGKETEYGIISGARHSGEMQKTEHAFNEFLLKNKISLERTKAALVPHGFSMPGKSYRITFCGDAIGLTKPWSGGGVIWGFIAADLLLKNFSDFLKYRKEARKFFLPKIIFSEIITRLVYFFYYNAPRLLPKKFKIDGDFVF